ncbi:hypothetical protein cypCar_00004083 [Cyprinus carpio]|nr:hypothetical protein cypCar_00004083 [Cyprinus carpio]
MKVTIAVLCLMWLCLCESRRLKRCDVVRIFKQEGLDGFEGFSVGNYVCTAYWESRFKTHRVRSADTGKDYGIFQINSFKWDTWENYCKGRKMSRWVKGCEEH